MSVMFQVSELATVKRPQERAYALQRWQEDGGVIIIGYEMYRNLTQGRNIKSKKLKETFQKTLVDPGEDTALYTQQTCTHICRIQKNHEFVFMSVWLWLTVSLWWFYDWQVQILWSVTRVTCWRTKRLRFLKPWTPSGPDDGWFWREPRCRIISSSVSVSHPLFCGGGWVTECFVCNY